MDSVVDGPGKRRWTDWQQWHALLFPQVEIYARRIPVRLQALIFFGLALVCTAAAYFLPAGGFIGFDWIHYWGRDFVEAFYPPWVIHIVRPMTWELLVGVTLAASALAVLKRAVHPASAAAALLALPLLWTIFLGQLEGLVVLGLTGLPWLVPFALVKPQVSIFALGARRSYLLAALLFLGLSFLIWGFWPARMFAMEVIIQEGRLRQDISLREWGLPVALLLFWLSRGDMDMLMLAGSFVTFHLIPYNLLPVVPAIARLEPRSAALACLFSWLPFSANWLGTPGWWLGWVFILFLWLRLAAARYPHAWRKLRQRLAPARQA